MKNVTLYVDLGKWKLGYAIFDDESGYLLEAGTYHHPRPLDRTHIPDDVAGGFLAHVLDPGQATPWVCEWPKLYAHKRKEHQDVQTLLDVGYAIERRIGRPIKRYAPSQWKGNVPKEPHHRRIRRALTPPETWALTDNNHDTWDAVGIGLFHLGRTGRGGVEV